MTRSRPAANATASSDISRRTNLARRTRPKNFYVGDSDGSDEPEEDSEDTDPVDDGDDQGVFQAESSQTTKGSPRKRTTRSQPVSKPSTAKSLLGAKKHSRQESRTTPAKIKRPRTQPDSAFRRPEPKAILNPAKPAVAPDWLSPAIPYSAWVDIFYYAAVSGGILDNGWLLRAATICRAFSEPALTTLYKSPSPRTTIKAKKLAGLLERPVSETLFNYPVKVESLYVDIEKFPLGLLAQVVHPLRRLKELVIYTPLDQPPYRDLDKTIRWHYPQGLFNALGPLESEDESTLPIMLKSWEWSSRLLGGTISDMDGITRIHQLPSFSRLAKLSFTNFQVPSLNKTDVKPGDEIGEMQLWEEDGEAINAVANAITHVPELKHLTFESSTIMNDRLLPSLPRNLRRLDLINCWEVKSDDLSQFLRTHGGNMRSLVLLHNQSLDLGFLTDLAETAPNLAELQINMSYYRHHESVDDSDPMYDQALLPTQVPLWPESLRQLEVENVRQWSVEAAEVFLQSLVDSAPNLPNLRHLSIKTMLNIPWQRRAELRHVWTERLERVFLRVSDPPLPRTSLRSGTVEGEDTNAMSTLMKRRKEPGTPSRRSDRIAATKSDDDKAPRSLRGKRSSRPHYREPDTDEEQEDEDEESSAESASATAEKEKEMFPIQGLCKTVVTKFDNQKVRELQYGMEDFNDDDDESSGDEWDGDDDETDEAILYWR
ncbi:hypothetical protein GMORB2_2438 [Geosmithia morbida]|uniref:Uncharacterized protein n=1 Tax=Geosmithia morbida TaxID=1094350 RepID=A0A9P4YSD3_9HYPO|nr:uncharacterized protein GMORB2_2438 [Geosmithia morbida]KAF4120952.1 hypothetical protein GMORB2_2438 [Geosmithia morbida]